MKPVFHRMRVLSKPRKFTIVAASFALLSMIAVAINWLSKPKFGSPTATLAEADQMAFNNNWISAAPLYQRAEEASLREGHAGAALYAQASQIPAIMGSRPLPALIAGANQLLNKPAANDPYVRLRILTVKGMLELEYDAGLAKQTWAQVEDLANRGRDYRLASRASGEQGILAFLLGNVDEASRRVKRAYLTAKILRDRPAEVRYASLIGRGIVEFGRYQESLNYLDSAISIAESHPEIAKPMIAYESKAEAFIGLKRYGEALKLIDHFIALSRPRNLRENLAEGLAVRAQVLEARGDTQGAIQSYLEAINNAQAVSHWHSLTEINAELAKTYERAGHFDEALRAIDAAIYANRQTPDEVYFVPQNLAIKAEIEAKSGHRKQAESLYQRGSDMLDALLNHVPTPMVERELISELSNLYSGYFNLLADDGRLPEAFQVIERAHGRIETQSLEFDTLQRPHQQTTNERTLNRLEFQLLDTSDESERKALLRGIYDAEQSLSSESLNTSDKPIPLSSVQHMLRSDEILIEYVLSDPRSSVLAITRETVRRYDLPSKLAVEVDCQKYSHELKTKGTDLALARKLYDELLPIKAELQGKSTAIVVADGALDVLPFGALTDAHGKYLISTMNVVNIPSATALAPSPRARSGSKFNPLSRRSSVDSDDGQQAMGGSCGHQSRAIRPSAAPRK